MARGNAKEGRRGWELFIPLNAGPDTINMVLTTDDGVQASSSIVVTRSGSAPFDLEIDRQAGMANLSVAFRPSVIQPVPYDVIEFDFNGDGVIDYSAVSIEDAQVGVTLTPGFNIATVKAKMQGSIVWTTRRAIYSWDSLGMYDLARGAFDRAIARLNSGNITAALNLFAPAVRSTYNDEFLAAGANLPSHLATMGSVVNADVTDDWVTLLLVANQGGARASSVRLLRGRDGIWRIANF